jgi:integrase/recombinase XerD
MARNKRHRPPEVPGAGFAPYVSEFLDWSLTAGYSPTTVKARERALVYFSRWCDERGLTSPQEVTLPIIERYQRWLYHYRKEDGGVLTFQTQHGRLIPIKAFFKWATRARHLLYNPASELILPRLGRRLPRHVLTAAEAEQVINATDLTKAVGIRDRAILETLYSTGIRRTELIRLTLHDIDIGRGTLFIRQGKGKRDRMIPIGARACSWVDKYLTEVRPEFVMEPDCGTLFISRYEHGALHPDFLTTLVRGYVEASGIGKRGSCHLFRHAMATLMLENGADIRFIQAMLGHANLNTTEVYTQVSIMKLKAVHELTHPARLQANQERDSGDSARHDDTTPVDERATLMAALDAEAAHNG